MFACGLAIAVLPWLSSKYALMGAALGLVAMSRPATMADGTTQPTVDLGVYP